MSRERIKYVVMAIVATAFVFQLTWLFSIKHHLTQTEKAPLIVSSEFANIVMPYFGYAYADFMSIKLSMSIWNMTGEKSVTSLSNYDDIKTSSKNIFSINSHIIDYTYMFAGMLHGKSIGDNEMHRALTADHILTYGIRNVRKPFSASDFAVNKFIAIESKRQAYIHPLAWELFFMRSMNGYLNQEIINRNSFNDMMVAYKLTGNKRLERLAIAISSRSHANYIAGAAALYRQVFNKETDPVIRKKYKELYEYYSFLLDIKSDFSAEKISQSGYYSWLESECKAKEYNCNKYLFIEKRNEINGYKELRKQFTKRY